MAGFEVVRGFDVVRGAADAEEVAAVLAVLAARRTDGAAAAEPSGYAAWRRTRLEALGRLRRVGSRRLPPQG